MKTKDIRPADDNRSEIVRQEFGRLYNIMRELRAHCPWDREQTHDSLRPYLLEEAYEMLESLDERQYDALRLEMGDLLLQVLFHSRITAEEKRFDLADVLECINDKLIRRHPHVFGDVEAGTADAVLQNWEQIKMQESGRKSVLDGVPKNLPALVRATRVQEKASRVGFDWGHVKDVWPKVFEELHELEAATRDLPTERIEEELGDVIFSIVNVARFLGVNPEDALRRTIDKFTRRFRHVERRFQESGKSMRDATLQEMDVFWDEAKARGM